ncbi:MAG: NADH:ubiquinone reductase (Na(+)-transporting) subunit A [Kiritimatiellae bacterium]|nr:NADH:ubiquinone reductase (Na(+)-transporting) subunit A [Kiritimatiellia bacterium]MCO5060410.1 NADH:ubiquinone reductase (Na(+)-transporting) subunit A [Kiritimatiellia bacterium]MCO6400904.1 NADH:ubiquinone reductase (Na(+)-transporting) subunit A [Verrucomicrobiota bacterium]
MASFSIRRGFNIKLTGAPAITVADAPDAQTVAVIPGEFGPIKPRLDVKEGDRVKRGQPVFHSKINPELFGVAPAAGTVSAIVYGARRALERIVITRDGADEAVEFQRFDPASIRGLERTALLKLLQNTGLIQLIRQRPFGRAAQATATPKSIFVNGMASAPFQADINALIKGRELAFQAGLDALTRLTDGRVFLCLSGAATNAAALTDARNVEVHTFEGPHPAGNTSVHISRLDPMKPTDIVWTIKAVDLLQIGHLLLNGEVPSHRVVALAGPGVAESAAQYYRVRIGQSLDTLLKGKLREGEKRVIRGDALSGDLTGGDDVVRLMDTGYTVLLEDRERHLLGWMMPGFRFFSASRAFISSWLGGRNREWALGTNQHGEERPMVLTGLYDKYMPLNILVDYLIRAVLAHDTDEAIKLGILETMPEDFALCAFACPSKVDLVGIIRQGLADIEKEGI